MNSTLITVMQQYDHVELFGLCFPRLTRSQLVDILLQSIQKQTGACVAFPDMSTINLVVNSHELKSILQNDFFTFNDGAGLAIAARLEGKPFPDNLNGTDLTPLLFSKLPATTKIYVVGATREINTKAVTKLKTLFPQLDFVGNHHGYLNNPELEQHVINDIKSKKPQIVLVGMGNPKQIYFIKRCKEYTIDEPIIYLAIGGLLHYYAGDLKRAPSWIRKIKLEWLYITFQQPHKLKRYFFGIPSFLYNYFKHHHILPNRG